MITRLVCCLFLQCILSNRTMAQVSIACLGSPGLGGCIEHRLVCTEPLIISITNITFGYRRGCVPLSSCGDTTCCREETGDCFTPYNQTLLSQLQQTCKERSSCTLNSNHGLNERSSYCFNGGPIYHSYSKIEYQCVKNTPPSTPQPTTETTPWTTTKTISNTISSNQASTYITNTQESKVSTACYGQSGIGSCTHHKLMCTSPLIISITNITFGYRRGCSKTGVANCVNTTCCREETGDCFTPYNQTLLSGLQQACNGRSTCTLNRDNGLDERSSYCFNGIPIKHSYSKIEYQCVTDKLSTPAPDSTTPGLVPATEKERLTDTDVGGIVGGIVGVILAIAIFVVVIFFIKRRLKKVKSQNEHQYDSSPHRIIDQPTPVYDSLNTRQQTDDATRDINEQQLPVTTNGHTQGNYITQDYEHAYDSTPSIATGGPRAVYDSLNTREQTGYYNMGNINATSINGRSPINSNNPDYEHGYSALDHDINKPKAVYDSLNTREQTGYYNMGSINTTDGSQQPGTANRT